MNTYLEMLNAYEQHASIELELTMEYFQEGVGGIGKLFRQSILIMDQFFQNCKNILIKERKQKEVQKIVRYWVSAWNKMTEEEKEMCCRYQDYPALKAQDADYLFKHIRNTDALLRLKRKSKKSDYYAYVDSLRDRYIDDVMKSYSGDKTNGIYQANIAGLMQNCLTQIQTFEEEIADMKKSLFRISTLLEAVEDKSFGDLSIVKFFKQIHSAIKQKVIAISYTFQSFIYAIKDNTNTVISEESRKRTAEYNKLKEKGNAKYLDYLKNSKFMETITFGNHTFELYMLPVEYVSCSNLMGNKIYADKTFFQMSKPMQRAIILHEIGHYEMGHFGIHQLPDEVARLKQLEKDIKKFYRLTNEAYTQFIHNDDELVYLLVELEADRFAAKEVGKYGIATALNLHAKQIFKNTIAKNPASMTKDEKLLVAYNQERMNLRNWMI